MVNKGDQVCWSRTNICLWLLECRQEYEMMHLWSLWGVVVSCANGSGLCWWKCNPFGPAVQCSTPRRLQMEHGENKMPVGSVCQDQCQTDFMAGFTHSSDACFLMLCCNPAGGTLSPEICSYLSPRKYRERKRTFLYI